MTGTNEEQRKINRIDLIQELKNYQTFDTTEASYVSRFLNLLKLDNCFHRDCFPAHITGSSIILNKEKNLILMNYHKSLNRWLTFGGHADGEQDILNVATRETMEESGLTAFKPMFASFIDIDIHTIPANSNKNEPEHDHYDLRYIMQMTDKQTPIVSEESLKLEWMTYAEAVSCAGDDTGFHRLLEKVKTLV